MPSSWASRRQFIGDTARFLIILPLVGQQILATDTPVLTYQAEPDLPLFQQTNQVRPRDI